MEFLVFIVVIMAVINALAKNAKKAQKAARRPFPLPMQPEPVSGYPAEEPPYQDQLAFDFSKAGQGMSDQDAYGCVGGSLPHEAHEGLEFPGHDHGTRSAGMDMYALEDTAVTRSSRQMTVRQMRSAVVMSEILSPPVSRRRR